MTPLARRASLRFFRRHPGQLALGIVGIALGVAVIVSIHMTRESARAAFDLTARILTGRATHQIVAGPRGLDETLFASLRTGPGLHLSAPVIDVRVTLPDHDDRRVRLLGVDPIAEATLRPGWGASIGDAGVTAAGSDGGITALMTEPGTALLSSATAGRFAVAAGDPLTLRYGGRDITLTVAAVIDGGDTPWLADDVLLTDIATAQETLQAFGRLTRIDVLLDDSAPLDEGALEDWLPAGTRLVVAGGQTAGIGQMTAAFYTNLTALGLLALLVGMFLIYSTQTFLVTQRRELFGELRALGLTRGGLALMVLLEAAVLGAAGAVAGIALGVALSQLLLRSVATTLNDFYFTVAIRELTLPPALVAASLAIGIAAAVAASLSAVLSAGTTPVTHLARIEIEKTAGRRARLGVPVGLGLLLLAGVILALSERSLLAGFAALLALALGAAALTPALMQRGLAALRARLAGAPLALRQALDLSRTSVSRTGVATAALMMAAATGIGVTVMIASFRVSVEDWLAQLLRADVYVSLDGAGAGLGASTLDDTVLNTLRSQPEIRAVTTARGARIGTSGDPARVVAYRLHREAFDGFEFLAGERAAIWSDWEAPGTIIVTEPFAWHRQLATGDTLMLETDAGPRPFTVRGIYRDYGSEQGLIAMSAATYRRHFDDAGIDGIGVYAAPGAAPEAVTRAIEAAMPADLAIQTIDNAAVRTLSLEVFDRTFIVTGVLRNLALIIACAGMFSSLMALGFERTRLLAIYRALGLSARELFVITVTESSLAGLAAGLVAVPTGIAMALGLIEVINVRSFGWSMGLSVPVGALVSVVAVTVLAALAAGIYPAWRAARVPVALALHGE